MNIKMRHGSLLLLILLALAGITAFAESLAPYPLKVCIVSGDKLDKDAVTFTYQGREIKTCCTNCIDEFYKDPAGFAGKIDEAAAKKPAN